MDGEPARDGAAAMRSFLGAAAGLTALLAGFALFTVTGHDDSHITYWAARTLALGGTIQNHAGEAVEQGSSLLHVLLLALLHRSTGMSIPGLGYWVGVIAAGLASWRALALCRALEVRDDFVAALSIASIPVLLYWGFGGLETTLHAWLMVEAVLVCIGIDSGRVPPLGPAALAVAAGLLLVRPEAPFVLLAAVVGAALLGWRAERPAGGRALWSWTAAAMLGAALLMAARLVIFDRAFPEPVSAKIGGSPVEQLTAGLSYLAKLFTRPYALPVGAVVLLAPWLALRKPEDQGAGAAARMALAWLSAHLAFVASSGGDWMTGGRFFAPVAPLCGALLLRAFALGTGGGVRELAARAILLGSNAAGAVVLSMGGTGQPAWQALDGPRIGPPELHWSERTGRVHRRDAALIEPMREIAAPLLANRQSLVVLSRQAGMVLYHTAAVLPGRIDYVDPHGLASRHVERLGDLAPSRRGAVGRNIDVPTWVEMGLEPRADVIFDVHDSREAVERAGYRVVYEQQGIAPSWGPLWPGRRDYTLYEYIAVRRELLPLLPRELRRRQVRIPTW
jgi:hypothetical protein